MTYPLKHQQPLSHGILAAGRRFDVPVIETRLDFIRALEDGNLARDLIDLNAGTHPSRLFYSYIVDSMLEVVAEQLKLGPTRASPQ